ncbi:MAG: hypothetical protein IT186_00900, partial [Acidobacteria bacterium]|nr:hypothetical protein [Acidobacteriota bacterium]
MDAIDIASLSGSYDPRWDSVPLTVHGVTKATPVLIRASYGGVTKEATLIVHPPSACHLSSLKLTPPSLLSGQTAVLTATID